MDLALNVPQQLFAIFFAIFWGTSSNAWPKWKPFHWTLVLYSGRVRCRVVLSVFVLNVIPVLYFALILCMLSGKVSADVFSSFWSTCRVVAASIVPAFAVFGFYRLWIGIVECRPSCFYYSKDNIETALPECDVKGLNIGEYIEPTIESLCLKKWAAVPNLIFGIAYIAVAVLWPMLLPATN